MKKIFAVIVLLVASVSLFSQSDITKFLGIPIDGFKPDMIRKLKEKWFTSTEYDKDILQGEFNGRNVHIHIVTNNNKVYRIMVADKNTINETDIKIRFNSLCRQFENNSKYISSVDNYTIPDDEDISYEMLVNNKRYEALFYQQTDSIAMQNYVLTKYTEEELNDSTNVEKIVKETMLYMMDAMTKKKVWFMIAEFQGEYYIAIYYDNEYNKANGEDL